MAPEGLQSHEITILSDLWSLGCVLYELFTGKLNFIFAFYDKRICMYIHDCLIFFNMYYNSIYSFRKWTGHPPFLAESFQQLKEKILHKDLPPPKVKGGLLIKL